MYLHLRNEPENLLTTVQVEPGQTLASAFAQSMLNMKIIKCGLDLAKTVGELGLANNATVVYEFAVDVHDDDVCVIDTTRFLKAADASAPEEPKEAATNTSAAEQARTSEGAQTEERKAENAAGSAEKASEEGESVEKSENAPKDAKKDQNAAQAQPPAPFNPFASKAAAPVNPFAAKNDAPVNPFAKAAAENKPSVPVNPFAAQKTQSAAPVNPFASASAQKSAPVNPF